MPKLKKSLGQHFLNNAGICAKIAQCLEPAPEDQILEIGPGGGALTRELAANPHNYLLLLEKDRDWVQEAAKLAGPGSQAVLADALAFPWERLEKAGSWKLCGNLPYNIASPLIWDIVSRSRAWTRAVFMVQKEVALRLAAKPGSKNYGALSVWVQSHALVKLEFSIKPAAFTPPPKVDSAVVSFLPRDERPASGQKLKDLLNLCFQNRRKQLGTIFRNGKQKNLELGLKELKINDTLRPEALTVDQFNSLAGYARQGEI